MLHKCDESLGEGSVNKFPFPFSIGHFNRSSVVVVTNDLEQKPLFKLLTSFTTACTHTLPASNMHP